MAENNITENNDTDDFLAEDEPDNDIGDFLAENNDSQNSDDFLADNDKEPKEKNWKIEYRDGLQGVVDLNGKVLIPFKKWRVIEYKNGIAKVSVVVDEMNLDCKGHDLGKHTNPYVIEIGFVDKTGNYISQDKIIDVSRLDFFRKFMFVIYTSDVTDSDKKRLKAKNKREKLECKRKYNAWKLRILSQN